MGVISLYKAALRRATDCIADPADSRETIGKKRNVFFMYLSVMATCFSLVVFISAAKVHTSGTLAAIGLASTGLVLCSCLLLHFIKTKKFILSQKLLPSFAVLLFTGLILYDGCAILRGCGIGNLTWLPAICGAIVFTGNSRRVGKNVFVSIMTVICGFVVMELIHTSRGWTTPCLVVAHRVSSVVADFIAKFAMALGGASISFFMMMKFQEQALQQMSELTESLEFASTLANFVAIMDIDGAEDWLTAKGYAVPTGCESTSYQQRCTVMQHVASGQGEMLRFALLEVLVNLRKYKPYLPDALFVRSEDVPVGGEPVKPGLSKDILIDDPHSPKANDQSLLVHPRLRRCASVDCDEVSRSSEGHREAAPRINMDLGLTHRKIVLCYLQLNIPSKEHTVLEQASQRFVKDVFTTVQSRHGTIHHYSAVSIFFTWGALSLQADATQTACMLMQILQSRLANDLSQALRLPISVHGAIHVDKVLAGNIGSDRSRTFYVDEDARYFTEALSKFTMLTKSRIIITQGVHDAVCPHLFDAKPIDRLLNKLPPYQPELVYELGRMKDDVEHGEWMYQLQQAGRADERESFYMGAFSTMLHGDFTSAAEDFSVMGEQRLARLCRHLAVTTPIIPQIGVEQPQFPSSPSRRGAFAYGRAFGLPWGMFEFESDVARSDSTVSTQ